MAQHVKLAVLSDDVAVDTEMLVYNKAANRWDPAESRTSEFAADIAELQSRSGTSVAGIVPTFADLPSTPRDGQAFIVQDEMAMYVRAEALNQWVGPIPVQGAATDAAVASAVTKPVVITALAPAVDARTGTGKRPIGRDELAINVRDYGATGGGSVDDSTAIQAAINAATQTTGRTVYLPPGTYRVNTALLVRPGVTLRGEGGVTILSKAPNVHGPVLHVAAVAPGGIVAGVIIQGLRIDGNKAAHTTDDPPTSAPSMRYGILAQNAHDLTVRDVIVQDTVNSGMYLGGTSIRVVNCTVRNIGKTHGIGRAGICVSADGTAATNGGVPLSESALIQGCFISGTGEHGIKLYPDCHSGKITGNTVKDTGDFGIYVQDSHHVTVSGNTVRDAGTSGILIGEGGGASDYCTVSGNTVLSSGQHGILINTSTATTITGNTSRDNFAYGIYSFIARGTVVSGNTCSGNGASNPTRGGGICFLNSSNASVTGNVCFDNIGHGISAWDEFNAAAATLNVAVTGNRCYDTGVGVQQYGVRTLHNSDRWAVVGNHCSGNVTAGVLLAGANNVNANNLT